MEIKNFVKIYDDFIPYKNLSVLLRYINTVKFEPAEVIADKRNKFQAVDKSIRSVLKKDMFNCVESLTEAHWHNFLKYIFRKALEEYFKSFRNTYTFKYIQEIQILKYENSDFYTWHTDHFAKIPRTMSCIFLLNNDYEGGNLTFRNPDGSEEWEVEVKPNRMIVWPSNFMYPHGIQPIIKGTRYSIVSWLQ